MRISRTRSFLFALIPVTVLLLLTEAVLRLAPFRFEIDALRVEHSGSYTARMFQGHLKSAHFVRDPVTFWKPRPSAPPFNSLGYRGEELAKKKAPGELRILAVGDSNTLGHEASWVNEIAGSLNVRRLRPKKTVTVINAGVYGYTSHQGRKHLRRFLGYRPDVVLISFGGNDATLHEIADKDYVPYETHPFYRWLGRKVEIVNAVEYLSVRWRLRPTRRRAARGQVSRVSLEDYGRNLVLMVRMARSAGALPVLLTRPMSLDYHAETASSPLQGYYTKTLRVAKRLDVALLDVDAMADHSWVLFADHAHFNAEGHRVIGRYVATALLRVLKGRKDPMAGLLFQPRDAFEKATDLVGRIVSRWRPLAENLAVLRARPQIRLREVYASDFTAGADGWSFSLRSGKEPEGEVMEPRDGALCLAAGAEAVTLARPGLRLAEDVPHFLWIEGRSRSDLGLRISWPGEEDSVQSLFYGEQDEVFRFFQVLPPGAGAVRVEVSVLRDVGDVCLKEIYLAETRVVAMR